jgi:adenine-specific DNA-methyltransferase
VCEAIIERHYSRLDMADTVLEPSCGDGRFLLALPDEVNAVGVEIDPCWPSARELTGRPVITGDFLTADIPGPITHVIGNPPFESRLIHGFSIVRTACWKTAARAACCCPRTCCKPAAR